MPLLGRGIRPVVPRFQQWDGFQAENFNFNNMAQGGNRSFPTCQPFLQIHYRSQPHSLPCCLAGGFSHVAPHVQFPRLNSPPLHAPNPPQYVPPPPPPQDQESETESSSSESSDTEEGNSLKASCSTP